MLIVPHHHRPAIPLSSNSPAAQCITRNDSLGIGWDPPHACSKTLVILSNQTLCPPLNGTVFQCGAAIFPALPLGWSETCTLVLLLPSVSVAPGNQSLPIPDWFLYCTDEEGSRSHTVEGWPRHHHGSRDGGSRTGVLAAFLQTTIITTNRRHTSGRHGLRLTDTTRLPCRHVPPKPGRPRFANSWGRGNMPVPKRRVLFLCQQVRHKDKIKQLQENLQKHREDLAKNPFPGWWQSQRLPWLLPIITPLIVIFVLLSAAPCIFKVLQQHLTELSRVTANQILVHQSSPIPSKPSPASHQP